ncbi:asparagine synthase (glutamine-hydrolyzing) [Thioalkalivibrio denitrificans]|uniref:asparagine synthase (glutamine-hydrolyzing) n=1 Tax=Thioalkalivibrio denitrificans TaxID=108003 RepID=A0A1V3NB00_9GAMM|nr:N-acetylglutaminylglutamine amidotransferase [Thioalkalivibrio denitrificans]OOG21986.1 asparagine synthase (glutamine-hydrolyzing) [Thioalkalivibrio denitrificans]
MCGICGELNFNDTPPDPGPVRRMLDRLARRGPDHEGIWSDGALVFGHRRLSILDLSERAHQPMVDPGLGLAVVFNGTIYNFRELRAELESLGHRFFSTGDSEVILKAYAQWGGDCVRRFKGMFAFALWDLRDRRLFLARDRMGIKPLYYSKDGSRLRFASNTQALLAAGGVDTAIDPVALHHHFTLHAVVPAPRTLFRGIRKLPPAHTLTVEADGRSRLERYWHLEAVRPAEARSEAEWIEAVHDSLRLAVERRLQIADVPVGVLLSGGLDSSLLVALLAESGARGLKTFTVGFEDQPEEKGSEFEYSDPVAARYATEHHRFHVPNSDVLTRLPEAVDHMAEPMVGQDAVAFYLLAEQVSRHVKVVQSGQGADEVFGGYFWYPRMAAETGGSRVERFRKHYFDRDHDEYARMIDPALVDGDHTAALIEELLDAPGADSFIDAVLRLDVTTLIVDDPVKRVDNMTMAWGLEARVPFLDHELVELAAAMPPELKLAEGGKYVLRQIARGCLPDAVIDRPKGYFPVPALKYVRGEFLDFMRDILDSRACRERGLYQRDYVQTLLEAPEQHLTRIQGSKLWHLALLEFWLQRNVDGT